MDNVPPVWAYSWADILFTDTDPIYGLLGQATEERHLRTLMSKDGAQATA